MAIDDVSKTWRIAKEEIQKVEPIPSVVQMDREKAEDDYNKSKDQDIVSGEIYEVLKSYDIATPFNTLRRVLTLRQEQNFYPLVNPNAIADLYKAVEKLERLVQKEEPTLEEIKQAFSEHLVLLEYLFKDIPNPSQVKEDEESLITAGNAFSKIYEMNDGLAQAFREVDNSERKQKSAELEKILQKTNAYIVRIVKLINLKLDLLSKYHN